MKHLWKAWLYIVLCLFMVVPAFADEPGQKPDYSTDYYMVVESPDGGINIYAEADINATKLNDDLIPNGMALHIEGETQQGERTWGFVEYHGMNGYVPLDDCKPVTVSEAVASEINLEGVEDVDYDVEVKAEEGSIVLYRGPGEKFGKKEKTDEIPNGEKLHITQEIEIEDKSRWGLTEIEDTEGWVNLEDTKKWQDRENAADMVSMSEEKEEKTGMSTITPQITASVTPTSVPKKTPTPSAAPTSEATPVPSATSAPAETPTSGVETTKTPEATPVSESIKKENSEDSAGREAASKDVKTSSSLAKNPFLWIGVISCLAVIGLLIYHFKKK